jgi:cytosine/adenosine deaminase-related metal-dependent hydrolase
MSSLLLKNGTVLFHEKDDTVTALRDTDVLVEGDTITGIGRNISAPNYAEVIDCTDKIVSPGFIDCHRHTWQTQLRGRHTDHTLFDYIPRGRHVLIGLCY